MNANLKAAYYCPYGTDGLTLESLALAFEHMSRTHTKGLVTIHAHSVGDSCNDLCSEKEVNYK